MINMGENWINSMNNSKTMRANQEKIKLDPFLMPHLKITSKWVIKGETVTPWRKHWEFIYNPGKERLLRQRLSIQTDTHTFKNVFGKNIPAL